jgi:putative effector of murein hydrolase LrgA (UPF0299 family)
MDLMGSSILQHLGLLFIPASVGVVLYLPVLRAHAWAISAALVISVLATRLCFGCGRARHCGGRC